MTDDPTEEQPMGALNAAKLHEVVTVAQTTAQSREVTIHTRAEQRLQADTDRAAELDTEIADDEDYAIRLRNQMVEMQRLLSQTESNIKKRKAERESCLESAHTLRKAGISLP